MASMSGAPSAGHVEYALLVHAGADHAYDVDAYDDDLARQHAAAEHALTTRQAAWIYRKGVCWCLAVSACVIMEGYDMILIGNFFAYPMFAAKYGQYVDGNGRHQLSAAWQAALANAAPIGCLLGAAANGGLVDRWGHRRVLLGALAVLSLLIFLSFFAPTVGVLLAGEFLCGMPWGVFATAAPAYAADLLPHPGLRGYLTSYTNMCFILGQLVAAAVLATLVHRHDEWAFRLPFALQWTWPAVLLPLLWWAPESPWYLVRTGRLAAAAVALKRIQSHDRRTAIRAALAYAVRTTAHEQTGAKGTGSATTYADCFRGTNWRRTEIACVAFAAQVLAGSTFAYNATYFFQQVGLAPAQMYRLNTAGTALALTGAIANWCVVLPRAGRRVPVLGGLAVLALLLGAVGLLEGVSWAQRGLAQAVLTLVWTFVFQLTIGQLGWAIPAEVSTSRLRQRTVCLARNAYYVISITSNATQPFLLNPHALALRGRAGFVWAATALLVLAWAYVRLPEMHGRTYAELDWLFAHGVPARQFATTVPDVFGAKAKEEDEGGDEGNEALEMDALVR